MENDRSDDIRTAALTRFWKHGYRGSSVRDLLDATGSNRAALYGRHNGKDGLFEACLDLYEETVVDPAFAHVERDGANLQTVRAYFQHQIARAEETGFPTAGCLIANAMTELAPHDDAIRARVRKHLERLQAGFANALRGEAPDASNDRIQTLSELLAVNAQGLWSHSRVAKDATEMRRLVAALLGLVERDLAS